MPCFYYIRNKIGVKNTYFIMLSRFLGFIPGSVSGALSGILYLNLTHFEGFGNFDLEDSATQRKSKTPIPGVFDFEVMMIIVSPLWSSLVPLTAGLPLLLRNPRFLTFAAFSGKPVFLHGRKLIPRFLPTHPIHNVEN